MAGWKIPGSATLPTPPASQDEVLAWARSLTPAVADLYRVLAGELGVMGGFPDHHARHEPGGADPMAVDAVPATGSLRTLGTGAQQAAGGAHAHDSIYIKPFNVRAYGAWGDGSHDDTTAIKAAYTAAGAGGEVFFPEGTYLVSSALNTIASKTITQGMGRASIIKVKSGSVGWGGVLFLTGLTGCVVRDIALDGNKAAITGSCWMVLASGGGGHLIENVTVYDASDVGIRALGVAGLIIRDCTITDTGLAGEPNQNGIAVEGVGGAITDIGCFGNLVTGSGSNGIFIVGGAYASKRVKVIGNSVTGSGVNIAAQNIYVGGMSTNHLTDVVVTDNIANGCLSNDGIDLVYCDRFVASDNISNDNAIDGLAVGTSSYGTIGDNVSLLNGARGILLTDLGLGTYPTGVTISGNMAYRNNQGNHADVGGIDLYNCVGNLVVANLSSDLAGSAKQKYGVQELGTHCDANIIKGNQCRDNVIAPYAILGPTTLLDGQQGPITLVGDSDTISNTAVLTAFNKTITVPAYAVNVVGTILRVKAAGRYSTTGTPTLTIWVYLDSSLAGGQTLGTANTVTDQEWTAEVDFIVRTTGAAGTVKPGPALFQTFGGTTSPGNRIAAITKNLTAAIVVAIKIHWSAANPANAATMETFSVEIIHPAATVN
jgi:hypothetical protein